MKIYIFTEGGNTMGFGHISRCVSLYQAFLSKGYAPTFIANTDNSTKKILAGVNYKILNWAAEEEFLKTLTNQDIAIIDSYATPESIYTKISNLVKLAVYFDDYNRINYPKGIIINSALNIKKTKYPKKDLICLLGNSFIALRQIFWNIPKKKIKQNIETVLITFGGSDNNNLTPKVLKFLTQKYPFIKKIVIVGKSFTNINEIKLLKDKKTSILESPSIEKIQIAMVNADVAISAGGQTINELARNGVPTLAFISNQSERNYILGWQKAGFAINFGSHTNINIKKLGSYFNKLEDKSEREQRSMIGQKMCDGKGAQRIISKIINEQH